MATLPRALPAPTSLERLLGAVTRHPAMAGLGAYLALVLLRYSLLFQGSNLIVGTPPDSDQHLWEIGWFAFAVSHGINPLTTSYLTSAHPVNLMWNNATPLLAFLLLPVTLLAGAVTAYNVAMVAVLVVSPAVCFLCLRRLGGSPLAAWLGGLLFGFGPPVVGAAQAGHLPWVTLFCLPLLLLISHQLLVLRRGNRLWLGVLLGMVLSAQLLIAEEVLADALLLGGLMLVLLAATHHHRVRPTLRYLAPALAAAAATGAVICAYPLYVQFLGPGRVHGSVIPVSHITSDLAGLVVPAGYQLFNVASLFPRLAAFQTYLAVTDAYVGLPLLAILVFALFRLRHDGLARWGLVLAVLATVLSLGSHLTVMGYTTAIPLPWILVRHLPLLRLAAPGRLIIFVYLGSALVVARMHAVDWARLPRALPWTAGMLCTLALLPTGPWFYKMEVPPFFSTRSEAALKSGSLVLIAPAGVQSLNSGPGVVDLALNMVWQAESDFRFRMTWGYLIQPSSSGQAERSVISSPIAAEMIAVENGASTRPSSGRLATLRDELRATHASYVVAGPGPGRGRVVELFRRLLGRAPDWRAGIAVWTLRP